MCFYPLLMKNDCITLWFSTLHHVQSVCEHAAPFLKLGISPYVMPACTYIYQWPCILYIHCQNNNYHEFCHLVHGNDSAWGCVMTTCVGE